MHRRTYVTLIILALFSLTLGQLLGLIPSQAAPSPSPSVPEPMIVTGQVAVEATEILAPEPGFWTKMVPEGKVAPGDALFIGPVSTSDARNRLRLLSRAREKAALALPRQRQRLHAALASLPAGSADMISVMAEILAPPSEEELSSAQEQLARVSAQCVTLSAPVGGIFLSGGEYPVLGRIVTSDTWSLQVLLPFAPELGQKIPLRLLSGIFETVEAQVAAAQWQDQGCLVELTCGDCLPQVAKTQKLTIKILSEYEIRGGNFVENRVYYTMCNLLWKGQCLCIP